MQKFISTYEVASRIKSAIELKVPFSLIRLGDGENSLIGYPEFTQPERLSHVLQRAFGVKSFDEPLMSSLISELRASVRSADIIGTYDTTHKNPHCSCGIKQLEYYGLMQPSTALTEAGVNLTLHEIGAYQSFLSGISRLGIISCRPVAHIFRENFGIKDINLYPVPQEHNFERVSGNNFLKVNKPHYPEIFNEILRSIIVEPGQLFFVGAGQLGKIYCSFIKERGGIAVDVGAMFDMWLGLPTRNESFVLRAHRGELMKDYLVKGYPPRNFIEKEKNVMDVEDVFTCLDLALMTTSKQQDLKSQEGRRQTHLKLINFYIDLQRVIQPSAFFEIGAFDADFSRRMRKIFPKADVVAFEANPYNFNFMNERYKFCDLEIRYENLAVSNKTGEVSFFIQRYVENKPVSPVKGNNSLLIRNEKNIKYEEVTVPATTLDSYIELNGYGAKNISAWIDVEGAVQFVMEGGEESIGQFCSIMIEVEDYIAWEGQWTFSEVGKYLVSHGFMPIARDFKYPAQYNIVYLRKDFLRNYKVRDLLAKFFSG